MANGYYYSTWYLDLMTIKRNEAEKKGNLTGMTKSVVVDTDVRCHVYERSNPSFNGTETSATIDNEDRLACNLDVDIQYGDEIEVKIYKTGERFKYIAGLPKKKSAPFGQAQPDIDHMEVPLTSKRKVE